MRCVIDGDQMIYACGFASQGEPIAHTLKLIKNKLTEIIEATKCGDDYELYIEGEGNFREGIAVTKGYKANRVSAKPLAFDAIREYMVNVWNAVEVEGMETDDKVSIELWKDFVKGGEGVILSSPDKDLLNTPGWHYNPRTKETTWITENQAGRHFAFQLLTGDTVDNIGGLPNMASTSKIRYDVKLKTKGCGKVSAKKVLSSSSTFEKGVEDVLTCYYEWGDQEGMSVDQTYDYFMEQAQLLWMVRELDINNNPIMFKLEEGINEKAIERATKFSEGY
jgi:hypothetical protein